MMFIVHAIRSDSLRVRVRNVLAFARTAYSLAPNKYVILRKGQP
jgi:hypothetical protein